MVDRRYLYIGGPLDGQRLSEFPHACPSCGHFRSPQDADCDYNANERRDLLRGSWKHCGCSHPYHHMTDAFKLRDEYVTYNNAVKSPTSKRDVSWARKQGYPVYETVIKIHRSLVDPFGGV